MVSWILGICVVVKIMVPFCVPWIPGAVPYIEPETKKVQVGIASAAQGKSRVCLGFMSGFRV